MKYAIGKKIEMSQIFKDGKVVPVTLIDVPEGKVTQIKTKEKDGYSAIQCGFDKKTKEKKIKKSEKGKEYKYLGEYRLKDEETEIKQGEKLDVSQFEEGDNLKISGISKGKGFQGGVKRWGFHGRSATHGMKHDLRRIGSIGTAGVGRVVKGKKMPGRMGGKRKTVSGVKVIKADPETGILAVKGSVPGRRGTILEIRQ